MRTLASVVLCVLAIGGTSTAAGDWPQILGPTRNGIGAADEKILETLPDAGPRVLFERPVGEGFSGIAVGSGVAVVFHRVDNQEVVEGLNPQTGQPVWKNAFPSQYRGGISEDNGPRAVPLIHQGSVYLFGAEGKLHCVSAKDGSHRWSRTLAKDYGAPDGYFGAGSTPIVEGDRLIVNLGGRGGAGLVALELASGKTVWKATDEGASYSSPVAVTVAGVRHVIFATRLSAISIDPADGKVRWKFRFGAPGPTVNAASPVVVDNTLFLTASYGIGAVFTRFGEDSAKTVWENDESLSSQYTTPVMIGPHLYGLHGRQDGGVEASLRCVAAANGKILWAEDGFGTATLVAADGKLIILKTDGKLVLARATPQRFESLGEAQVLATTTRALPALAGGRLYVRDTQTLKCLDLRPQGRSP